MGTMVDAILRKLLDRLDGWKTAIGFLCLAGLIIAPKLGLMPLEEAQGWYKYAGGLFGFGMIHKQLKRDHDRTVERVTKEVVGFDPLKSPR